MRVSQLNKHIIYKNIHLYALNIIPAYGYFRFIFIYLIGYADNLYHIKYYDI